MTVTPDLPAEWRAQAERTVQALRQEAAKYTAAGAAPVIELDGVRFTSVTDPFSQQLGYEGVWLNARGDLCGTLTINSDGSFYAEYDLFCPHPSDARWFVEMVTAWGDAASLRCEAQMIPSLEE